MKKSIIALSTMFLFAIGVANAQTESTEAADVQEVVEVQEADAVVQDQAVVAAEVVAEQVEQDAKTEIKADALPDKVQEILKSDRFNTWDVSKAYEMTDDKDRKIYEVVLTNGEKKATYKFDAEGKTIG